MSHRALGQSGEMAVFARVVETGSFSAAGRALELTPSAVSKLITRLEARLGVRLLARSTRAIALTAEGEAFHQSCIRILAEIEEAESTVAAGATPRGRVRVNASVPVGGRLVVPLLPQFLARHPGVEIDITLTDTVVDLFSERADVVVRAGPLADTALVARKLMESRRVVVASPAYLDRRGVPRAPDDLCRHDCLCFNFRRVEDEWPFVVEGAAYSVPIAGSATAGDGETLRSLAVAGIGLARLAEFHVAADLAAGQLVPILEKFNPGDREAVHALFPGGGPMPSRVRAFLDFLVEHMRAATATNFENTP